MSLQKAHQFMLESFLFNQNYFLLNLIFNIHSIFNHIYHNYENDQIQKTIGYASRERLYFFFSSIHPFIHIYSSELSKNNITQRHISILASEKSFQKNVSS